VKEGSSRTLHDVLDLHIKHHNWKGKNRGGENGIGS
jgi:hypothetical protein